ncbi:Uncharacterised protein [Mycobacterium tuberculosis]|uniref:Uncharacterized protein n=1 Tax=Mycobacterium tuberculosis TaxID=1773 RepID=A0A654U3A9_MYCTX|nr:Uncharacterised protein [Mycobacterium tuberculosis]CNV33118.1 Uncharacterised protein [Mycobacterium tuberculosis]
MATCEGAAARRVVAAGRTATQRRRHDQLGSAPTGRESRPARVGPSRTARGVFRPTPAARHPDDRVDLPGGGALPRHPRAASRHPLAPGEFLAANGVRSRSDGDPCPHPADCQDVLYKHRIRFGPKRIRALNAARHLRRRTGLPGRRNQPAAGTGPSQSHHPNRNHRAVRPQRWPPGGVVPVYRLAAKSH